MEEQSKSMRLFKNLCSSQLNNNHFFEHLKWKCIRKYLSDAFVDSSEVSLTELSGAFDRMEGTFSFLGVID